jgi:hypothetical protein
MTKVVFRNSDNNGVAASSKPANDGHKLDVSTIQQIITQMSSMGFISNGTTYPIQHDAPQDIVERMNAVLQSTVSNGAFSCDNDNSTAVIKYFGPALNVPVLLRNVTKVLVINNQNNQVVSNDIPAAIRSYVF